MPDDNTQHHIVYADFESATRRQKIVGLLGIMITASAQNKPRN
jgi:hypothetical protein